MVWKFALLDRRCERRTSGLALDMVWWVQTVSGWSRRIALYLALTLHLQTSTTITLPIPMANVHRTTSTKQPSSCRKAIKLVERLAMGVALMSAD
jgi:hypothetical protein